MHQNRMRILIAVSLIFTWLGFASIGGPYFGKIEEVSSNDLNTFLPESAESTELADRLEEFRPGGTIPVIVVFESRNLLSDPEIARIEAAARAVADSNLAKGNISSALVSDDKKAAYFLIPLDSKAEIDILIDDVRQVIDSTEVGVDYSFTGPAMFSRELNKAFAGIDGTLLIVALSVVFVILIVIYRSPILPVITLVGAIVALASAIFVVWNFASIGAVQLNGQVQGILFILVIGATVDYALLYIARYREELMELPSAWAATKASLRASWEPIIAAGGTVSLGLLCLLASDLGSNKALGPVGSIGILFSVLVALTFLPAVLLLLGRAAFWPINLRREAKYKKAHHRYRHPAWSKVAQLVARHPRRLWIGIAVLLFVSCLGIFQLKATGVSQDNIVIGGSEAKSGQDALDRHFAAGSGSPAYVLIPVTKQDVLLSKLEADHGVSDVGVLSTDPDRPILPLGQARREFQESIRTEVKSKRIQQLSSLRRSIEAQMIGAPTESIEQAYQQATSNVPSVDELVASSDPFKTVSAKIVNESIVLAVTLTNPASSVEARQTIQRLRSMARDNSFDALIGGVSAAQLDTNTASNKDLRVVLPLILMAITIVLMLLLRAIVAPIVLLLTTVLSFGATIGIAALVFNYGWNFEGADPVVIIFGFVFLVALGIDYNIFLMTRVREETLKLGVREGTLKALVVTGGVITSAGIVLASTFAALNVIPVLFLVQIAFIVAFGVLIDTLIVRSLLVPALTLEIGQLMWWPSKLWQKRNNTVKDKYDS